MTTAHELSWAPLSPGRYGQEAPGRALFAQDRQAARVHWSLALTLFTGTGGPEAEELS